MVMGRSQTPSGARDDDGVGSPMPAEHSPARGDVHTPKSNSMSSGSKRKLGSSPARTMHHDFKAAKKKSPMVKQIKSFKDPEKLTICLNIYDLVWDKNKTKSNAGLADLGLGFYHTGLELWGKELSFGHSKRFTSGVFAVKPKKADELMPHTVFRQSITMDTIYISRYSVDKILNRLSAKYTSDAYNVVRNNCNHFTEELCQALCGKDIPEWVNRPAKMGTSTLDVLNAPFEAFNNVIKVFTPSKKSNTENRTPSVASAHSKTPRSTPGRMRAPLEGPTEEQLESIGEIPDDAQQIGRVSRTQTVPLLGSPVAA